MVVQSHAQVLPEQTGRGARAVPAPHAHAVAGQPLDNASLPVWSIPGHDWVLVWALIEEPPVPCQLWLDNKFLESLGQLGRVKAAGRARAKAVSPTMVIAWCLETNVWMLVLDRDWSND